MIPGPAKEAKSAASSTEADLAMLVSSKAVDCTPTVQSEGSGSRIRLSASRNAAHSVRKARSGPAALGLNAINKPSPGNSRHSARYSVPTCLARRNP